MLKLLARTLALILVLILAGVQSSLATEGSDPGDGTAPIPFDIYRVDMTTTEIEKAGAQKAEDNAWIAQTNWDGYKCDCALMVADDKVKQAIFRFPLNNGLLGMLTSELASRGLMPLGLDDEVLAKKPVDELEGLVNEKISSLDADHKSEILVFYVPSELFEKAAQAKEFEDIEEDLQKNIIHAMQVDVDENHIVLVIARGSDYDL